MIQSYTTNNYPIAYSDHRTILADKYGVIKVQGVVVITSGLPWLPMTATPP